MDEGRNVGCERCSFADLPLLRRPSFARRHEHYSMWDAKSHTRKVPHGVASRQRGSSLSASSSPRTEQMVPWAIETPPLSHPVLRSWASTYPLRQDADVPLQRPASPAWSGTSRQSPTMRSSASSPHLQTHGVSMNNVAQLSLPTTWVDQGYAPPPRPPRSDLNGLGVSMDGGRKQPMAAIAPINTNLRSATPEVLMPSTPLYVSPASSTAPRIRALSQGATSVTRRARPALEGSEMSKRPSSPNLGLVFRTTYVSDTSHSPDLTNPYATPDPQTSSRAVRQKQLLLNEMAETERSYAGDLCVITNMYINQARLRAGVRAMTPSSLSVVQPSSRASSASSEPELDPRALSGDADPQRSPMLLRPQSPVSSGRASPVPLFSAAPPLSVNDIQVIFAGVESCTSLALSMSNLLAAAARGECNVSSVFLDKWQQIEQVFSFYCSRHEASIARLSDITGRNPAASAFLRECDDLSRQHTTAWDLPSLLIKPVQRVLKYPLFLHSIIECTEPHDPEYAQLQIALRQMEGVANRINESKKRMDIVGQHGFEHPVGQRSGFRSGPLRRSKTPSNFDTAPLTDDEDRYHDLVAQLHMAEKYVVQFTERCSQWMQNVRRMYLIEIRAMDEWIAVYRCSDVRDAASLERLHRFRELLHWRVLNSAYSQLETSMHHAVYLKLNALQNLLERPKMVILNRAAKEPDFRRYLHERARRPKTKLHGGAMAFLSMHVQLVNEIPTLLRCVDFVMKRCLYALTCVQMTFFGQMTDLLQEYGAKYMPGIKTPVMVSPITGGLMSDMLPSSADSSMIGMDASLHVTDIPSPQHTHLPLMMQNLSVSQPSPERVLHTGMTASHSFLSSPAPHVMNPEPLTLPTFPSLDIPASMTDAQTRGLRPRHVSVRPTTPLQIQTPVTDVAPAPPIRPVSMSGAPVVIQSGPCSAPAIVVQSQQMWDTAHQRRSQHSADDSVASNLGDVTTFYDARSSIGDTSALLRTGDASVHAISRP